MKESKKVSLEDEIKEILFNIGKDIKVHKLINGNMILEIDYEKHTQEIINAIKNNKSKN